ncbi:MAG: NUDIX domain-containing protein [Candidatus Woesearchaeota archaeon]
MAFVLQVDNNNNFIKKIEKLEAHKKGILHRAYSIFIFNSNKELLLQKRAEKYHSSFLWSNTCCSHPFSENINEIKKEAEKRLFEEMGFKTELKEKFQIIYKADVGNNLIEHEYDHVFFGSIKEKITIKPDIKEVCDFKWISFNELKKTIEKNPKKYTAWLKIIIYYLEFFVK